MKDIILERFQRYVVIDTKSDESSSSCPSTTKQFDLLNLLKQELLEMGIKDVSLDEKGYLMATIPSNIDRDVPAIGFIAHVDTSPDNPGNGVKPQIHRNYQGGDIQLNKETGMLLTPVDFPELLDYIGFDIITTDGTTLLGADDKAGVTEIMAAADYIMKHPEFRHGPVKIGFTPDEEIGRGVDHFDVGKFGASYAYTMDGGAIGELEYENFNAAHAKVSIQGRNIHPGYAKNKMVNAMLVAMEFNALLPVNERPEFTEGYEGFYHIVKMEGSVENASLQYIIRDHDRAKFEKKKEFIQSAVNYMNTVYDNRLTLELRDQYYNMREKVEPVKYIVDFAEEAMIAVGVKPVIVPIRGGTDGSRLSYMGLPCPNIFAGGHNFHGKYEYVPLDSMVKAYEVILKILSLAADRK